MAKLFIVGKPEKAPKKIPTLVQLTIEERLKLMELGIVRMICGKPKPTNSEAVSEALALLFRKEGI